MSTNRFTVTSEDVDAWKRGMSDYNECHNPEGPGGGQFCSEGVTLYHGTRKDLEDKIMSEGLRAVPVDDRNYGKEFYVGDRAASVFLTDSNDAADSYAFTRSNRGGGLRSEGKGIIFEVHIPASEMHRLAPDEYDNKAFNTKDAFIFKGDIPPSWIKKSRSIRPINSNNPKGGFTSTDDDGKTILAVILFDDGVKDYNPCHEPAGSPEGGRFTEGPCAESDLSAKMLNALEEGGGFTFTAKGKTPKEGFAVGGYGTMPVFDVKDFRKEAVSKFLADNKSLLSSGKYHVGGWVDDGKVYLDMTRVFKPSERREAIKAGRSKNQIAITDLGKIAKGDFDNAFIKTGGTGKPALTGTPYERDAKGAQFVMFDPDASADEIYETLAAILKESNNG